MKRLILPSIFALAFSIVSLLSLNSQARTSVSVNFGYSDNNHYNSSYHNPPVYVAAGPHREYRHNHHSDCHHNHSYYSNKSYGKKHWKKHHSHNDYNRSRSHWRY